MKHSSFFSLHNFYFNVQNFYMNDDFCGLTANLVFIICCSLLTTASVGRLKHLWVLSRLTPAPPHQTDALRLRSAKDYRGWRLQTSRRWRRRRIKNKRVWHVCDHYRSGEEKMKQHRFSLSTHTDQKQDTQRSDCSFQTPAHCVSV